MIQCARTHDEEVDISIIRLENVVLHYYFWPLIIFPCHWFAILVLVK